MTGHMFTFENDNMVNCRICATPYMELFRSSQVTRIAKLPNADVSRWLMVNKEVVELCSHILGLSILCQTAGKPSTQSVRRE